VQEVELELDVLVGLLLALEKLVDVVDQVLSELVLVLRVHELLEGDLLMQPQGLCLQSNLNLVAR
jgi:hypothetical protein